jgi:hypothetical protein
MDHISFDIRVCNPGRGDLFIDDPTTLPFVLQRRGGSSAWNPNSHAAAAPLQNKIFEWGRPQL